MYENRNIIIRGRGYNYIHGDKTAKFESDLFAVAAILAKDDEEITAADRCQLLKIYRPSYHETGKIEGVTSFDSTATNCEFCQAMRKAANENPLHICGYCYDYAQEHGYKGVNVLNRHTLNMIIMSTIDFSVDELRALHASQINRVNSSGDVPNVIYARNMLRICYAFDFFKFGFWAKNTLAVIKACDELGKPSNVTLVQSSCMIGKPAKLAKYFDFVFTVYLTKEDVAAAVAAGAGECNGKKCEACGYKCYKNGWTGVKNVAEFLRTDKKTRDAMIARMNAAC